MARQKLSEYRAKTLLLAALDQPYHGTSLDTADPQWEQSLELPSGRYVVKVDEGIKQRFKRGLVMLDQSAAEVPAAVRTLAAKGYRYVLIEPFQQHQAVDEGYFSIERTRAGNVVTYSRQGGVDVEANAASLERETVVPASQSQAAAALRLEAGAFDRLIQAFDDNHFSFLEINPLVVTAGRPHLLDAAVLVDGEAAGLVGRRWTPADFREARAVSPEETAVNALAAKSQASFRLEVLNPDGQVFLLLSGGGASVALADEVHNQGFGRQLANYGEYSGNPKAEEAYLYAREILSLLLKSPAERKVLVIAGGVANFTDIRVTFQGLIRALDEVKAPLAAADVKVFVRRGGPHEAEGLAQMTDFLNGAGLYGLVAGPDLPLTEIIPQALRHLKEGKN